MPMMLRALGALFGLTVAGIIGLQAHQPAAPASEPLDRRLLDQYCVTCHNERLRTAGLTLEKIDLAQVRANAKVLESVVHKLRGGQMPPQGRPRPAKPTVDSFAAAP